MCNRRRAKARLISQISLSNITQQCRSTRLMKAIVFFPKFCSLFNCCLSSSVVCDDGFFGVGCESECHCNEAKVCAKDSGACPDLCAPGWNGTDCQTGESFVLMMRDVLQVKLTVAVSGLHHGCCGV